MQVAPKMCHPTNHKQQNEYHLAIATGLFQSTPYSPGQLLPQHPQPKQCVFFLRALRQDHLGRPSVRRDRQFAKPAKSAKAAGHNADVFFWATPKLPWREDVVKCFPRLFKKALRFEMMFRKKYEEEQCLI